MREPPVQLQPWTFKSCFLHTCKSSTESLSKNEDDSDENVTFEKWIRAYSISLNLLNAFFFFSGVEFERTVWRLRKRKRKLLSCILARPPQKVKLGTWRRSCAVTGKKCTKTKMRDARASLCFAFSNPLLLRSRCRHRRIAIRNNIDFRPTNISQLTCHLWYCFLCVPH